MVSKSPAKKLRAFERKQLEQKLKDDRHAAQVASKTLGQIEHQIDVKKIGLDFLDNRTERFVKSAVVEAARESDLGGTLSTEDRRTPRGVDAANRSKGRGRRA